MFFDEDDDDGFLNPELYQIVSRELYTLGSQLESHPFGLRSVPTHTEDGIPIRKLYVSNLPPKVDTSVGIMPDYINTVNVFSTSVANKQAAHLMTTRTELFGVFAQYGFIKSCWLRMGEKGPHRSPTPTYAFVTYSNPADAHKALQAPMHEKTLRGRNLRISPADSWHQPAQDADGRVRWKPRSYRRFEPNTSAEGEAGGVAAEPPSENADSPTETETTTPEPEVPNEPEETPEDEESYNILDILNRDCLTHILSYIPITHLIRSERVSKRWQSMVQEYLQGIRTFKTSWWGAAPATLTTAVLRRVLQRVGGALARLHIDHHWSALNDRTAHTVGKFCPNLEELMVVGMHTKNWNPLIYGCKQLKSLTFVSCNKLTDSSLVQIVKSDSCIESLEVANNTHVTGLFLTGSNPPKLNLLSFFNCYSLQGTVLCAAIDTLPNLTALRLDVCPISMWKIIPLILNKLPRLVELSLSEYLSSEIPQQQNNDFCESISHLTDLKLLNLSKNIFITNVVLKQIAQSCTKLEALNISSCFTRRVFHGVGDEGLTAICGGCRALTRLDVSYLGSLTDAGLRATARLPRLTRLVARGIPGVSAAPLAATIAACHTLQLVDVCGCDSVSEEVVEAAQRALELRPRPLTLRLASTAAASAEELPKHKLLSINVHDDLSIPNLRPDFVDNTFEDSSEDSFDDLYDHEDFDEFFGADDELFMDEDEMENYEGIYAYGLNGQDIILL